MDYSQYEIYDFDRISAFNLSSDDLSQASMAQMAGISKDYFSRIFKSITGLNYNKWINTIRLEKATELLSSENMPLTEVAMLSGFRSIPSFNRVFREEKGMTPGEYRTLFDRRENHEH
ncbi:MAG: helix-turn-helix transcriptional regulator [Lachnospiraceae bacterium]|nr:helix-turn-helix transcriptional regulator [Lachnospiraceae bacterium]